MANQTYTVKKGDTLSGIASSMGVSMDMITGYRSGNKDKIYEGEVLTIGSRSPVVPSGNTGAGNTNDLINRNQQADYDAYSMNDVVPVRQRTSIEDLTKSITGALTSNLPRLPETPSFADRYMQLQTQYGTAGLEEELNALNAQIREQQAIKRQRTQSEEGKPVATNVIAGRVSETERQENERIDALGREASYLNDQLKTKYSLISTIMNLEQTDYQNAVQSYDRQFSQNLQILQAVKSFSDTEDAAIERERDNARANLQIVYNNMTSGGMSYDSIDENQKTMITKLEAEAGLPIGFYKTLQNKNPKADIISTSTRQDASGKKYADIVMRGEDGKIYVQSQFLGSERLPSSGGSGGGTSTTQKLSQARASMEQILSGATGPDNYVAPEDYIAARSNWVQAGFSSTDFDKEFKRYVNPLSYGKVGFKQEKTEDVW